MHYIKRLLQNKIKKIIAQDKSVLLLGPRQSGKTTLLEHEINADLSYSFLIPETRRQFELSPDSLIKIIQGFVQSRSQRSEKPLVLIDEIQKIPALMDVIQYIIDKKLANFILTGSSARKLKYHSQGTNLLPGRVIVVRLDPLCLSEIPSPFPLLESLLSHGSLPEIILRNDPQFSSELLTSYVNVYLEEEIRLEANIRNLPNFSRFLTYAAIESGNTININNLSQEIGVSRYTIEEYFQILEDCLIVEKINPVSHQTTRRRLAKLPKYLFFDLGVRRIAAGEGEKFPQKYWGNLFEQFIGIELLKLIHIYLPNAKLLYWKDHAGPEIDYVLAYHHQYLPIEIKWTNKPGNMDANHMIRFMHEYDCVQPGLIVCRVNQVMEIQKNILAIPWKDLPKFIRIF